MLIKFEKLLGLFSKKGSGWKLDRSSCCLADIWAKDFGIIEVSKNTPGTTFQSGSVRELSKWRESGHKALGTVLAGEQNLKKTPVLFECNTVQET